MKRNLVKAEIAALEERLHLNRERMGVDSLRELQRSPVIQHNLLPIFGAAFAAGAVAGLVSKEVKHPFKKMLPFLLKI